MSFTACSQNNNSTDQTGSNPAPVTSQDPGTTVVGQAGPAGPQGPQGNLGKTILMFSSGNEELELTTTTGGITGQVAIITPYSSVKSTLDSGNIEIDSVEKLASAFISPVNGTITKMVVSFSNTRGLSLMGTTVNIRAQLFEETSNYTFSPVSETTCSIRPALSGLISGYQTFGGDLSDIYHPMVSGKRYMVVVRATADGSSLVNTIHGVANISIEITPDN